MSYSSGLDTARYSLSVQTLEDIARAADNAAADSILRGYGIELDASGLDAVVASAHCVDFQRLASLNTSGVVAD